ARSGDDWIVPHRRNICGARISCRTVTREHRSLPDDRGKAAAGARTGRTRTAGGPGPDGGDDIAQFAEPAKLDEDGAAGAARESKFAAGRAARLLAGGERDRPDERE